VNEFFSYLFPDKKFFRYAVVIFLTALCFRLFIFGMLFGRLGEWEGLAWIDANQYIALAKNLLLGNGFSLSESVPFEPLTLRTPGYPLFLSVFYYLFGVFWPASLFAAVLNSFVPVLIFWLTIKVGGNLRTAAISGFLIALDYHVALHTLTLNTESIFVFITVLVSVMLYWYFEKPSWKKSAIIGMVSGYAALTRAFFLYIIPFIFIFLVLAPERNGNAASDIKGEPSPYQPLFKDKPSVLFRRITARIKMGMAPSLCFLFISLAFVVPWMYRNKMVSGQFTFTSVGWYDMYTRTAAMVEAVVYKKSYIESLDNLMKQLKEEGHIAKALEYELFDAKFIPLLRERSLKILQAHPKETFLIQLNSVQTLFTQDDLLYILNHSQLLPDAVRPPIPLSLLLLQKGPSAWRDMLPYLKGQYLIPYIMRPIWAVFWALSLAGVWVLIRSADSRRYMIYFFILFSRKPFFKQRE